MAKILLKLTFLGLMCLWLIIAAFLDNPSVNKKIAPSPNVTDVVGNTGK